MADQKPSLDPEESTARSKIGRHIVYWAIGAVTILGVIAIATGLATKDKEAYGFVKDVLSMLLPVIGAWVGTVLAFYFSRENYIAATENNAALLGLSDRLQTIRAESAMIPMAQAAMLKTPKDDAGIKLKEDILDGVVKASGRNRIPIASDDGVVRYVVHRSVIDKFIGEQAAAGKDVSKLTLKDLVESDEYKDWVSSFASVKPTETLGVIKSRMDSDPKCSDVIVTDDGSRGKPALGWVTNVIVMEKSRA